MRRALISVSDKSGITDFATKLIELGFEIVSTGGTARMLTDVGLPVTKVSEVTGFPEIMDGRVKTLHPRIHAGLLARADHKGDKQELDSLDIAPIDLVVVNLYPFQQTIARPGVALEEALENIDIGGPSMLRAAAKNFPRVTVLVDPADYEQVLAEFKQNGDTTLATRKRLAAKVFRHTAAYDALIAEYLSGQTGEELPERLTPTFVKVQDLRYGENPHQKAAFYAEPFKRPDSVAAAEQLHGKELSYNNINDADAAISIIKEFSEPTVAALKHTNPCGVGSGNSILEAFQKAYESDPISIFGGIVACNRPVDEETARKMREIFLEIVIAPDFTPGALEVLQSKKNLRILKLPVGWHNPGKKSLQIRGVTGGLLVQETDKLDLDESKLTTVTEREPTPEEMAGLRFGWKVVKHVKSNAIVLARDAGTVGIGAGQMNRVGAAVIAIRQAGDKAKGAVLASDAFFPMPDTVQEAARAGVTAIIQPGGSIRDKDSIEEANKHGIAMVFTGIRHFRH